MAWTTIRGGNRPDSRFDTLHNDHMTMRAGFTNMKFPNLKFQDSTIRSLHCVAYITLNGKLIKIEFLEFSLSQNCFNTFDVNMQRLPAAEPNRFLLHDTLLLFCFRNGGSQLALLHLNFKILCEMMECSWHADATTVWPPLKAALKPTAVKPPRIITGHFKWH